ncbi:MAG: bacteriohemerythrin [Treponema sp.]|jgi:hemerythrin|nr:bacteriohemerythrin [Treponema sp.]
MRKELIIWSPTYSVGIALIDEQHKELLKLTNDMFNHCIGDPVSEREYFKKVIHEAVNYVKTHFATEEKIMLRTAFPGYANHKKEHDSFVLSILEHVKNYEEHKTITLIAFTHYLKNWILTHIAVSDKQYFTYFKHIATRKSNGMLSISQSDIQKNCA